MELIRRACTAMEARQELLKQVDTFTIDQTAQNERRLNRLIVEWRAAYDEFEVEYTNWREEILRENKEFGI